MQEPFSELKKKTKTKNSEQEFSEQLLFGPDCNPAWWGSPKHMNVRGVLSHRDGL